jgi:hypothetical protein
VRFVIAEDLDAFTDRCTDERAFDRLMVIDGRACHGTDHGSARLAVVVAMMNVAVMMRSRECTSGGEKERNAQQCRLQFLACHVITSAFGYCEIGAG